jgi:hypothetical protein
MSAPERMPRAEMLTELRLMLADEEYAATEARTPADYATCRRYADALAEALRLLREQGELLRDAACAGVEFEDPRIGYVVVQIDRDTWAELAPYRAALAGSDKP